MTTRTYASVLDHSTDAAFRAWGSEFDSNLAAAGLVQTADTGQVNWTTAVRPAVNTATAYTIWRLPDSTIYFKFEYGTGGDSVIPAIYITVGQGSNGTGTLTGQLSTRTTWLKTSANISSTTTAYTTFISRTADSLNISFKHNAVGNQPFGVLSVGKSVDASGAPTTLGYGVLTSGAGAGSPFNFQSVRTAAPATTFASSTFFSLVPGNPSSSNDGADLQVYHHFMNLPRALPSLYANTYIMNEINETNTFTVAMVGSTMRTYLALGEITTGLVGGQSGNTYSFGLLWE